MMRPWLFVVIAAVVAAATPAFADAPAGITADDLRRMPKLSAKQRAAMREACASGAPSCDRLLLLGNLERQALVRALVLRNLVIDPAPQGKIVGALRVYTAPVFGEDERLFTWANFFHISSKEYVIEREILLRPGEVWDQETIDETQRKLRDPVFTTLAVLVPVLPGPDAPPGTVDVLAVSRDIFSLRMNSNYELQNGRFTFLTLSLSENNFLGRRKFVAMVFLMDQATFYLGPLFVDKNVLGRRHDLRVRGGPIFKRSDYSLEGSESSFQLSRPLWSLDTEWSWSVQADHRFAVERSFIGGDLRTYNAPSTPEDDMLPYEYHQRRWSVGGGVTRAFGDTIEHRVKGAYDLTSQRPEVLSTFMGSPEARADFEDNILPRNERTAVLYGAYEIFTARYREYQDIDSFDLAEDTRLGPRAEVTLGAGLKVLGSDANFGRATFEAGMTQAWGGGGLATISGSFSTRLERGDFVDRVASVGGRVTSPNLGIGRVVGELRASGIFKDESNRFLVLGGDNGLRGYPVGTFAGDRRLVFQGEFRTRSVKLFLGSRWGALAFYDVGGADEVIDDVQLYQDVGIGIRALGPQLSPEVFRFDLAFPLTPYTVRGVEHGAWPPRFIAGYRQAF
ncbi:MAG TPA: hypothetical protein VM261_03265 [Kofleriaceae bacterium]|nr:hypothetical protein [Kofleriaceae bacterium]